MENREEFIKVFRDDNGSIRLVTYNGHGSHTSVLNTKGALLISEALKNAVLMNENDESIQEEEVVKTSLRAKIKALLISLFYGKK